MTQSEQVGQQHGLHEVEEADRLGQDELPGSEDSEGPEGSEDSAKPSTSGPYRVDDGSPVTAAEALALWSTPARDGLLAAAGTYRGTVTYKELAAHVQEESGVRTSQLLHNWIGKLLVLVSKECDRRGEPLLPSLCVNQDGSVGTGYAPVVVELRGEPVPDGDRHAAEERLACYRHFGATLPADGGRPALTPALAKRRETEAVRARAERPAELCPTHFLQLSVSGACSMCEL